jgi:Recombination endonuclease VII
MSKMLVAKKSRATRQCPRLWPILIGRTDVDDLTLWPAEPVKRCAMCLEVKPRSDFYESKGKYTPYCKPCFRAYGAAWKRAKREDPAFREYERQKRLEHNARNPSKKVRRRVGMTVADFEAMRLAQNNQCAICEREFDDTLIGRPRLDHDHATNKARGLLCHKCNIGIGAFGDVPALIARALRYLEGG